MCLCKQFSYYFIQRPKHCSKDTVPRLRRVWNHLNVHWEHIISRLRGAACVKDYEAPDSQCATDSKNAGAFELQWKKGVLLLRPKGNVCGTGGACSSPAGMHGGRWSLPGVCEPARQDAARVPSDWRCVILSEVSAMQKDARAETLIKLAISVGPRSNSNYRHQVSKYRKDQVSLDSCRSEAGILIFLLLVLCFWVALCNEDRVWSKRLTSRLHWPRRTSQVRPSCLTLPLVQPSGGRDGWSAPTGPQSPLRYGAINWHIIIPLSLLVIYDVVVR